VTAATGATASSDPLATFSLAVAEDLSMLAALHDAEPNAALVEGLRKNDLTECFGLKLEGSEGHQALELMRQALQILPHRLDDAALNELAVDYASIYLNHGIQASPEESVWIDDDHLICQESMFQVREWYQRYGLAVPDWRKRPDDHLVTQLQFLSHLFSSNLPDTPLRDAARFMDDHLLRWLSLFSSRVAQRCATPFFAGAATLTAAYCEELRDLLAVLLEEPRPTTEEIDARMQISAPPPTNPEAD